MKKGESQRIYWQQWLTANGAKNGGTSRRELITSSAAIRISPDAAKAKDVTQLLRKTLNLSSLSSQKDSAAELDAMVLVGTLYSLPNDYVQFEHNMMLARAQSTSSSASVTTISSTQAEPFHVVKTLKPEDNPLSMRDKMMDHLRRLQHLAPSGRSNISPKFQWFFVPSSQPSTPPSPIPSCIDLDGYCTSMEEEEYGSDDESLESDTKLGGTADASQDDMSDSKALSILNALSLVGLKEDECEDPSHVNGSQGFNTMKPRMKELRRFVQMTQSQSTCILPVSGYLLKQSHVDRHVWRRVYCVLTDDHLWFVTRVPYSTTRTFPQVAKKHGRISLERALLLEPNKEYASSPLYRIPNGFEVVSAKGTSHVFRAPSLAVQMHWIQALSNKITESFENSLMSHAELIVADESSARNKRLSTLAVDPLWTEIEADPQHIDSSIASVLQLGMDVAEYREQCRHIQASVPARSPVVVSSEASGRPRKADASREPIDAATKQLVQATWDMATKLLSKATNVAMEIQKISDTKQLSRSLEVLCRHVDYVITGQHRQSNGGRQKENGPNREYSSDPPPMDLFDLLLAELQSIVGGNTMSC
mmetsp:Transcript_39018/g.94339  ORF Transcript_39018/g.94339 Transcript_39018/m.94339 type:complete len:592 (-) Transcript_39018:955-2730(-)|eukprot:CAMPEP_0113615684 /NCGR_PEP_ID=MMETSP0017_2-20120614/7836_1 /TAXON_ID=2856 /ORGANISM="Cylindrotheca closterium" /LENGTH=591 /DNA_ID=CAMNT_0000524945 /DNA_START=134 /DNA_END=1909 /DNA_ORIENTATION=- /assembly_acc=CAM_ASM_000147